MMLSELLEGRWAYLFHLCGWSLPVIVLQLFAVARLYRGHVRLVLKTVANASEYPRTIVFDEIDSGIGGRVSEAGPPGPGAPSCWRCPCAGP